MEIKFFAETLSLTFDDQGQAQGPAFLVLHGGAGPKSVAGLSAALAGTGRVITPTHPGFDGHPRPDGFTSVSALALSYLSLIEKLDLTDVVVIGNSIGGWIAAEMALFASPRIAAMVLLNAVGIDGGSPALAVVDPSQLPPAERAAKAFFDPQRFAFGPATPEAAAMMLANLATLRVYGGTHFSHDPTLRPRLAQLRLPSLLAWGESDGISNRDYGKLYADSIPGAQFKLVREAGHFPQLEQLETVTALIKTFIEPIGR